MKIQKLEHFDSIYSVDTFWDEYKSLFKKDKNQHKRHLKKLFENLRILDERKSDAILHQQFEKLKNSDLYSIRHVSELNPRVIFVFAGNSENSILLACTLEKSKNDYDKVMIKAKERLKELEGYSND